MLCKYVVFLNDDTWTLVDADNYIYNIALQTLEFYRNGEFVACFNTEKIIGFCIYERVLLRILKGQKACNGFEGVKNENSN